MLIHIWLVFILCCQAAWSAELRTKRDLCYNKKKLLFLLHAVSELNHNKDFKAMMTFIENMIKIFQYNTDKPTQIAMTSVIAGYKKEIRFDESKTLDAVLNEVIQMKTQTEADSNKKRTTLFDAIYYVADFMCNNSSFMPIIMVITNAKAAKSDPDLRLAVDASKGKNIHIIAVGIGKLEVYQNLHYIVTEVDTKYMYQVESVNKLSNSESALISDLILNMCLDRPDKPDNNRQDFNKTSVNRTVTRQASVTQSDCRGKSIDLQILLAGPQAWRTNNLTEVIRFIEYVIKAMDVRPNVTQLHITASAHDEATLLLLNPSITSLHNVSGVLSKIEMVDPKTSVSLSKMKDSVFTKPGSGAGEQNTIRVVIIINVGPFQPEDVKDTKAAAQRLKHDGIKIVAIGVNGSTPEDLENIASTPLNQMEPLHFEVDNYTALVNIEDTVVQRVCREGWVKETKQHHAKDVSKNDMPILYFM